MASDAISKSKQPAHQRKKSSKLNDYIQSIGWIVTFTILAYYLDLSSAFFSLNPRNLSVFLALMGTLVFVACFLYLFPYSTYVLHRRYDLSKWEQEAPRTIQVATAGLVLSSIAWNIALWPVYGWATPFLLFMMLMAIISIFTFF